MRFASSISTARTAERAVQELLDPIDRAITAGMVDLCVLFCTAHFEDELGDTVDRIGETFPGAVLLGCTTDGTIGVNREVERAPAMSLLVGSMPGVEIRPFHLRQEQLEAASTPFDWEHLVGVSPESHPFFLALGDPFRIDIQSFVEKTNRCCPRARLGGGVASAGHAPRQNRLILNGDVFREGIVGVSLTGAFEVDTVVSQGCRPIGTPFVITRGDRNVIYELGGKPVLEQLHHVLINLPDEDEKLARESLFVGRVIDEHLRRFGRGDFLVQNIVGVDRRSGAVGVQGYVRAGTTVQFHVRDAASADQDLRNLLGAIADRDYRGVLIFGCNGRGTNMWTYPNHDAHALLEEIGDVPVAGAFCGGEFGPVGGKNFVHGFTASIALFRNPDTAPAESDSRDTAPDGDEPNSNAAPS